MNPDQIEGLPITQIHRDVDLAIVEADKEGYVKSYIVIPSTIYGLAKTRFVDAGIQNRHSVQIPTLIGASIARGQGGMVGLGKNFWPNVEIHERKLLHDLGRHVSVDSVYSCRVVCDPIRRDRQRR